MSSRFIGSDIGGYRIIEPIGSGGMAKVFKAYDPRFDRFVALKILPDHFAEDAAYVARFTQEAKVIARLEHSHIVPVYDFGDDHGTTYLAMRYLRAGTLKDLLLNAPGGRLPLNDALRIVSQVASALDYAHQQRIIHRDVKPANILIDMQGGAYLTDFGVAKVLEGTQHLTSTGGVMGTPAYMSPEQGSGKPVDRRSDVYSLGVILYQMLTGQTPYQADTPVAIILAHTTEPLTLPSTLNPAIPQAVEEVIFKALAKKPEDRYPTAGALAAALERVVNALGMEETLLNASPELLGLSAGLAGARPSDEVTRDVRIAARRKPRRGHGVSPLVWAVIGVVVIGLVAALLFVLRQSSSRLDPEQALVFAQGATLTAQAGRDAASTQVYLERLLTGTVLAQTPSPTHEPTATHTISPAEAAAAPILAAIASRPPGYEDGFENPASGWLQQSGENGYGYVEGEYFVRTSQANCLPSTYILPQRFQDLALRLDVRYLSLASGSWIVGFRDWYNPQTGLYGQYYVVVTSGGGISLTQKDNAGGGAFLGDTAQIQPGLLTEGFTLTIIAQGKQFVVYANDRLVIDVEDPAYTVASSSPTPSLALFACSDGSGSSQEVRFDNLRIWDISDLAAGSP